MDYGYVIKFNDNQFNVGVDLDNYYSGYGVVPRTEDPDNMYDIEDVREYCRNNPSKVLTKHPLEDKIMAQMEIDTLKAFLNKTDYVVIKSVEEGDSARTSYAGIIDKRKEARARINELETLLA